MSTLAMARTRQLSSAKYETAREERRAQRAAAAVAVEEEVEEPVEEEAEEAEVAVENPVNDPAVEGDGEDVVEPAVKDRMPEDDSDPDADEDLEDEDDDYKGEVVIRRGRLAPKQLREVKRQLAPAAPAPILEDADVSSYVDEDSDECTESEDEPVMGELGPIDAGQEGRERKYANTVEPISEKLIALRHRPEEGMRMTIT